MVVEAERTGRGAGQGAGWSAEHLLPGWIRPLASGTLILAAIAGSLGGLYVSWAISGSAAQAAAVATIGLAGIVGVIAFAARRAHVALAAHLDILGQALDAAPDAQLIVAPDGCVAFANIAFDRVFCASREPPLDRIGRALSADPQSQAEFDRLRRHAAAGHQAIASLCRRDAGDGAGDGATGHIRISVGPIAGHRGYSFWGIRTIAPEEMAATAGSAGGGVRTRSIVRALEPEDEWGCALRPSREWLHRIFANAPVGIALLDRFGRFEEANRALGELLDTAPQNLIGAQLIDFLNADDRDGIAARLSSAADRRADREPIEVRLERPRDRTMVVFVSRLDDGAADAIAPASSAGGRLALHFIDVTEQKNLELQFAQSQKMQAVGQLAGGVAHDFNNLLTAMIGFCDLLLLRSRPGDPSFADVMQIKQNANRAANLVRQLLAFARQQTLQPRVLNITDVLVELSHLLRRLIGENLELKVVHGRDLSLVKVDESQFEQVIINLAVNARDAMPQGGALTIRTANVRQARPLRRAHEVMPAGDYVRIEVADTGVGIAKDNLARIFDPFFSTKEVGSGTGLGLSMVDGIVKQTGGFVFVDSAPGRGTVFEIYLPRHQAADAVPAARLDAGEPAAIRDLTGAGTIMLVEDDDPVRIFAARALRNRGYRVIEAKGGETALDLIRAATERIDLLITDVVMPRMDGPALIREVREIDPEIKVIFISGYAEDAFRQRLDRDAEIDFLPKPFSLKQLAIKVKEVIGGAPR